MITCDPPPQHGRYSHSRSRLRPRGFCCSDSSRNSLFDMFRRLRESAVYLKIARLLKRCMKPPCPQTSPQPPPQACDEVFPLLQLPPEILLCIIDHLPLIDQYFLSQTCRALRLNPQRDWHSALQQGLNREQRFYLFAELAFRLHDQYACSTCCKMHRITAGRMDVIRDNGRGGYDHDDDSDYDYDECTTGFQGNFTRNFGLNYREHHLQIILKAQRLFQTQLQLRREANHPQTLMYDLLARTKKSHREHHQYLQISFDVLHRPSMRDGCLLLHNSYRFARYAGIPGKAKFKDCPHLVFYMNMAIKEIYDGLNSYNDPSKVEVHVVDQDDGPIMRVLSKRKNGGDKYQTLKCSHCLRNGLWNSYVLWFEKGVLCLHVWRNYGRYWDVVMRDWERRQPYLCYLWET